MVFLNSLLVLLLFMSGADSLVPQGLIPRHDYETQIHVLPAAHSFELGEEGPSRVQAGAIEAGVAAVAERRSVLRALAAVPLLVAASATKPSEAEAIPFLSGGADDRRQLEYCLVHVIRVQFWAETVAASIGDALAMAPPGSTPNKSPYVEGRLGAKALLTGRVGGGANGRVYGLASLQIKGCLKDAQAWYVDSIKAASKSRGGVRPTDRRRQLGAAADDVAESLAACVEFDGLDNTLDPSPRSSLMVSQFTSDKATFVRRTLAERTVPACEEFTGYFGSGVQERCERYVRETYPSEIPQSRSLPRPAREVITSPAAS